MAKDKTAHACLWFALILLLLGAIVGDPSAAFALTALAGVMTLVTIALGNRRLKLSALLALLLAVLLALAYWPEARKSQERYREHARRSADQGVPSAPPAGPH